jgi:phosphatidylserine decarboxylase
MPLAVQSIPYLATCAIAAIALGIPFGVWGWGPCVLAGAFIAFFFRDPERVTPGEQGLVVSPADGRVTEVERGETGARVAIFLSVFNCHINRSPVDGEVIAATYTPGRFRAAWDARAGHENERNHLVIRATDGTYGVTQVAGILARRIVCTKGPGARLRRGERIGLIQFGSRTDLHLPPGVEPVVRPGDRVRGATTVLARRAAVRATVEGARAAAGGGA